jgi:hypothetical protein
LFGDPVLWLAGQGDRLATENLPVLFVFEFPQRSLALDVVYDPYGNVTIYTRYWLSTRTSSLFDNTILFAGRDLDTVTGLYNDRAR